MDSEEVLLFADHSDRNGLLYGIFFIYLGIYGYGNPDPNHAYFIDEVK